jgi:hypothetical protein
MKKMSQEEIISIIKDLVKSGYSGFFSVRYQKLKDDSIEWMNGRLEVKKHETGGGPAYDFAEKEVFNIWCNQKKRYTSLKYARVLEIKLDHEHIIVEDKCLQ